MARLTVEQGALTSFLDELPKLLLQYQQLQLEDKAREESNQVKVIEHLINVTDRKNQKIQGQLDAYEKSYEEATGSIYRLDDTNSKEEAINILDDMTGNVITDLSTIANEYTKDTENLRTAKRNIQGELQQIGLIQDFYSGLGHDYKGGIDKEAWDKEDFSSAEFKAYMDRFPELEGVESQPFFEGLERKEEAALDLKIEGLNKILEEGIYRQQKIDRSSQIIEQNEKASTKADDEKKADKFFKQKLSNIEIRSGMKEIDYLFQVAIDEKGQFKGVQDTELNPDYDKYVKAKAILIKDLSSLLGKKPSLDLYNEYSRMIDEAEGSIVGGKYSKGDVTSYHSFIEEAYENYKKSDKSPEIERLAQDMFGFSGSFDAFYNAESEEYKNYLLLPFEDSGQVSTDTLQVISKDLEWDNILEDEDE